MTFAYVLTAAAEHVSAHRLATKQLSITTHRPISEDAFPGQQPFQVDALLPRRSTGPMLMAWHDSFPSHVDLHRVITRERDMDVAIVVTGDYVSATWRVTFQLQLDPWAPEWAAISPNEIRPITPEEWTELASYTP